MYPEEKETVGYTRIGKNILRLPSLEKGDIHKLRDSLPAFRTFTWSQIWEVLLVKEPAALEAELKHLFPEIDFEAEVTREHLFDGRYDKMLGVVLDHIKDTIQQQKEYLVSLLAQDGYTGCRVGLVNNSINGSGQYLLESFMKQCGLEGNILGLQIMRSELCRTRLGERAIGWLNVTHADRHAMFEFEKKSLVFEHFLFESACFRP